MILETHPYWHFHEVVAKHSSIIQTVTVSRYQYVPKQVEDHRELIELEIKDFLDKEKVFSIISETDAAHELSIHSLVSSTSGPLHLPMVDMSTSSTAQISKIRHIIGESLFDSFSWYRSGRSFHGYGSSLMNQREWASFMGLLLLANDPAFSPIVDPRWIGHRLVAGYSALRWTKNSDYYLSIPKKIYLNLKLK